MIISTSLALSLVNSGVLVSGASGLAAPLADLFVDASATGCASATGTAAAPYCTITAALAAAADGDRVLIAPGTYSENLDVVDNVEIVGLEGRDVTIVDGGAAGSVITIASGVLVAIEGLTVTGGLTGRGGGIFTQGALVLQNSTVSGNTATNSISLSGPAGGGIYVGAGGDLSLIESTVTGNDAWNYASFYGFASGGGLFIGPGSVRTRLVDSSLVGNEAVSFNSVPSSNGYGRGGGMTIAAGAGPVSIERTSISDNEGGAGAGIFSTSSQQVRITDSTISANLSGGGAGVTSVGTPLEIEGTTISENSGISFQGFPFGIGVLATDSPSLVIRNSTISGHLAGGLVTRGTQLQPVSLSGVTITGNSNFYFGTGGWEHSGSVPGELENTIIAGNSILFPLAPSPAYDVSGDFLSRGHNLIGEDTGSTGLVGGVLGDQVGTAGAPLDPGLAPLADNGGPSQTHALLPASPAIDAASISSFEPVDQRGLPRLAGLADIGAFERDPGGPIPGCNGVPNSTGMRGALGSTGTTSLVANDFTLQASSLPPGVFGLFLTSRAGGSSMPASSVGELCLGGSIGRFVEPGQVRNSGAAGTFSLLVDLSRVPARAGFVQVQPGETWFFQAWHRDVVMGAATSNFTRGIVATFR